MNPYDFLGMPGLMPNQRQVALPPEPVTEEEASGLFGGALDAVSGGLSYVGETLDKPGAALRGLLAGRPDQLANLIPFSDAMGITRPEERTSGRDLLETWGALDPNTPGLDWGDVGGFAAEVALDPLWFVSGPLGTVAKGEKYLAPAAKGLKEGSTLAETAAHMEGAAKAGFGSVADYLGKTFKNPATYAEQIRKGERGLVGIKNPFTGEQLLSTAGIGGETTSNLLEKMFYGKGGKLSKAASAPIRGLRSLFSPYADYHLSGEAQKARDIAMAEYAIQNAAAKNVRDVLLPAHQKLTGMMSEIAAHHRSLGDNEGFDQFSRMVAEYKPLEFADKNAPKQLDFGTDVVRDKLAGYLGPGNAPASMTDDFVQGTVDYVTNLRKMKDVLYKEAQELGLPTAGLDDMFSSHFFRRPDSTGVMRAWKGRKGIYRDVPGGSKTINALAADEYLHSSRYMTAAEIEEKLQKGGITYTPGASKADLRKTYDKAMKGGLENLLGKQGQKMSYAQLQDEYAWTKHIMPALESAWGPDKSLLVKHGDKDISFADTIAEWTKTAKKTVKSASGKVEEKDVMSRVRKLRGRLSANKDPLFDRSLLKDFTDGIEGYMRAVSTMRTAHHYLSYPSLVSKVDDAETAFRNDPSKVSLKQLWKSVGWTDKGLAKIAKTLGHATDPETLAKLSIDPQSANRIKAFSLINEPMVYSELGKKWDRFNALYRGSMTSYFPGFHVRNIASGLFQNIADGPLSSMDGVRGLMNGYREAFRGIHRQGKYAPKHLESFLANGLMGKHLDRVLEGNALSELPKGLKEGYLDPLVGAMKGKESWNPMNAPGVNVHFSDAAKMADDPKMWWGAKLAKNAYAGVEFMNRYSQYHALMESGYSAAQSAHHVMRTHFDYGQLSKFERQYMRRFGPTFYGWLRKSVPYTVSKLLESPGGVTGQTIRGLSGLMESSNKEGGSYTPNFLRERVAIPWGDKNPETGEQTFFTASGLPVEDLNMFSFRGDKPDITRTVKKGISQLPPFVTQPVERLFDEQLYTGRKLSDLKNKQIPFVGEAPDIVSGLAQIGPWSRLFGEAGKAVDDRKSIGERAANLLTGAKFSTYDTDRWKILDAIESYRRQLEESGKTKEFSRPYITEEGKATGGEQLMQMFQRYGELEKLKRERIAQEKAKKAANK